MSWLLFVVAGPALGLATSLTLFIGALVTLHGPNRRWLWGPGCALGFIGGWTLLAFLGNGSLWPIPMMVLAPPCALLVAVIWCVGLIQERGPAAWYWCLVPIGIVIGSAVVFAARADYVAAPLAMMLLPFSLTGVALLAIAGLGVPRLLAKMRRFRGII